jgi:hypothetical protein
MCRFLVPPALVALLLWAALTPVCASSSHANPPAAEPEHRILVEPLGYRPPGSLYLLSERAFSTLDFIDADHLLFTFHQARLLRRETDAGKGDSDQIIQALTLKLPEGTVQASAEWRMHDRSRYLWSIGGGKFLVRQRDSFLLTDSSLQLKPYVEVATPVMATEISADGRILVIEHEFERHTADQHNRLTAQAEKFGDAPPSEDTEITMLDTASRRTITSLRTESPIHLPATTEGYVGVKRDKNQDQFVLTFYPFEGKSVVLGKVASTCTPHENFLSARALLIESCGPKTADTYLDAWTIDGKKLWTGMRESHFVWPTFAYAAAGTRFAVGLLRVTHAINLADSLNDEDVREQVVQVYEVASGALLLTVPASPVLTAGQNFALSADGERLAVLHQGAVEIYRLPPLKQ